MANQSASVGRFHFVKRESAQSTLERAPYGLKIIESCTACPYRENLLFCNLPSAATQRLSEITSASTYPKGAILFVEDQAARGVFIVCTGTVKLSTSSVDGRTLIVRFSEPGELLGLPATITGKSYSLTAEVIQPTQVRFIARHDFLSFLREFGEVALRVAQQLGETYHAAVAEMRTIGLSHSAEEKLAQFLLDWTAKHESQEPGEYKLTLTHEEIAEVIGSTRETVTRTFADLKKKNLLATKGSTLRIKDRTGLEKIVQRSYFSSSKPRYR